MKLFSIKKTLYFDKPENKIKQVLNTQPIRFVMNDYNRASLSSNTLLGSKYKIPFVKFSLYPEVLFNVQGEDISV